MPALISTEITGTVVWLGRVSKRQDSMRAEPVKTVLAQFSGIKGEDHSGLTRLGCSRTKTQYDVGTVIRNVRQLSIVSAEELDLIAKTMGLDAIQPEWLGASLVIRGIPDFTMIPPSSRLQFASGVTVTVDMENRPCQYPAREIEADNPGYGKAFKPAAQNLRGVTGWVEREGQIDVGDAVTLHVPDQRAWAP